MENPFGCEFFTYCSYKTPTVSDSFNSGDVSEPAPPPTVPAAGIPILSQYETDYTRQFLDDFSNDAIPADGLVPLDSFGHPQTEAITSVHGVFSSLSQPSLGSHDSSLHPLCFMETSFSGTSARLDAQPGSQSLPNGCHFTTSDANQAAHSVNQTAAIDSCTLANFPPTAPTYAIDSLPSRSDCMRSLAFHIPGSDQRANEIRTGFPIHLSAQPNVHRQLAYETRLTDGRPRFTFGSDAAFQPHFYAPPPNTANMRTAEGLLAGLEAQHSASNTRPPSPVLIKSKRRHESEEGENQPRRQRSRHFKSDSTLDVALSAVPSNLSLPSRRGRRRTTIGSEDHDATLGGPSLCGFDPRPQRQNLTEEEKKLNHIKSEQKRRNQIKAGFSDLMSLLPDSATAGPSKCVILARAVEWLTGLIEGNERLRVQLKALDHQLV